MIRFLPLCQITIFLKGQTYKQHQKLFLSICKSKMLTSSAVVSEEHIKTSSKLGSDGEVSCMYKDSTVPRMSSVMGF